MIEEEIPPDSAKIEFPLSREQFDNAINITVKALELRINGQELNGEVTIIDALYKDLEIRTRTRGLLKNSRRIPQIHRMLNEYHGRYVSGEEFSDRLQEFRSGLTNIRTMPREEAKRYLTACQAYSKLEKGKLNKGV